MGRFIACFSIVAIAACVTVAIGYRKAPAPVPVDEAIEVVEAPRGDAKAEEPIVAAAPEVGRWATVRGRIVFDGPVIPKQAQIPGALGALTEDWVINAENRGVRDVIVWLAPEPTPEQLKDLKAKKLKEFPTFPPQAINPITAREPKSFLFVLPLAPRAFIPHVGATRAGDMLIVRNLTNGAETFTFDSAKNGAPNKGVPNNGMELKQVMVAEKFPIGICSTVTPWARAWLKVFDHPYFCVTNVDGEFEIPHAPVGPLRLFVWHPECGFRNGAEGRFGEPIRINVNVHVVGELKIKELR